MNNIPTNLAELFAGLQTTKHGSRLYSVLNNLGMGRDEQITRDELAVLVCGMLSDVAGQIEEACEEKDAEIARLEDEISDLDMKVDNLEDDDRDELIEDLEEDVERLTADKKQLIELCLEHGLIVPFHD